MTKTNKKLESNDTKMNELGQKLDVMEKLLPSGNGILVSGPREGQRGESSNNRARMEEFQDTAAEYPQQKLEMVVFHLNRRAESWYFSYHLSRGTVRWSDFVEEICRRFEEADNNNLNLLGEFKKLEKFEDLKAWVLITHPTIPEEFFLGFFIEGLKDKIKHTVKILDPFSLSQAVEKIRHQEKLIETINKKSKSTEVRMAPQFNSSGNRNFGPGTKLIEARRARGEFYKCGEKYYLGHQCKDKQLNALTACTEIIEEGGSNQEGNYVEMPRNFMEILEFQDEQQPEVLEPTSLNVFSGTTTSTTINIRGLYGKKSWSY
ncbi:hypothetical protein T459_08058 [Capsicum annuum]|uniref:Retrotransposon gag domain-containing protein n=1 Tax=Capsicum annuum TaxID=4072 RepID=A0A2G2ZVF4_CAPAN|nr:hypothetical protein T459_08058 [Capsicum annuum]